MFSNIHIASHSLEENESAKGNCTYGHWHPGAKKTSQPNLLNLPTTVLAYSSTTMESLGFGIDLLQI